MKKLIAYCVATIILVVFLDIAAGAVLDYLRTNSKSGHTSLMEDITARKHFDVIVLGSSRACHHYATDIMSHKLNGVVANAGIEGTGIISMYGFTKMIFRKHKPWLIVYDVTPEYDYLDCDGDGDMTRYTSFLRPYAGEKAIRNLIGRVSPIEKWRSYSNLYRYNSIVPVIFNSYISAAKDTLNGFRPMQGTMSGSQIRPWQESETGLNETKVSFFREMICLCRDNGVKLIFVASPRYGARDSSVFEWCSSVASEEDVPFIDLYSDTRFVDNVDLFHDPSHLNSDGAAVFTDILCDTIIQNHYGV